MAGDRNGGDLDVTENDVAAQAAAARQYDWRPRPDPTVLTTQQLRETEAAILRTVHELVASLRELLESRLAGMDKATELLAEQIGKINPELATGRQILRTEFAAATDNLRELIGARIDAIDGATKLLAAGLDKSPTDIDRAISQLKDLLGARIDGMDTATKLLAANVDQIPTDVDRATKGLRELLQGEIRNVQDVAQQKFNAIEGTFASNALALTAALAAQKEAAAEQNKSNTLAITKSEQATKETIAANAAQNTNSLTSQAATISDLKDRLVRIESGGIATGTARGEQRLDRGQIIAVLAVIAAVAAILISAFHP